MEKEILNYLGDFAFYGCVLAPLALILAIFVIYTICILVKVGYAAIKDLFTEDHGPFTVIPNTPPPQPPIESDGHFIDDPMAVVNTNPDFKGIGDKPIPATKNGIIINGAVYAYKKADLVNRDDTVCSTCDLCDFCEREDGILLCSVFPESDEDGCHFERI